MQRVPHVKLLDFVALAAYPWLMPGGVAGPLTGVRSAFFDMEETRQLVSTFLLK